MERFYASLKTLRPVQAVVLVMVLLASGGSVYAGYEYSSRGSSSGLADDQQLIPVTYGDLVRKVTTSGSLEFPNREVMSFGAAGTVAQLLVQEGQQVTAGQEVARLDAATAASLAQSSAQAHVNVIAAQTNLDELLDPTPLAMAQARQNVASAEFDLRAANEALDAANIPFSQEEIKAQEQSVASARLQVQNAEESLNTLGRTHGQSLAQALLNKADAEAALVDARNALEAYQITNTAKLDLARADQIEAQKIYDEIAAELANLLKSQAAGAQGLEGTILQYQELLAKRRGMLDTANAQLVTLEQLIAKKDKQESDLAEATAALDDLGAGFGTPVVEAQLASIEIARTKLETVQASGLDTTVAEAELAALKLGLSAIESGVDPVDVGLLEADLVQTWAKLGKAKQDLADMLAGPDAVTVVLRSRAVDVAVANLEQAKQDLEAVMSPNAADVALLESKLDAAKIAYDATEQQLDSVSLKAPFAGLISAVPVSEGDQVGASTEIVEIVDPTVVEMAGIVDEIDILLLREGLPSSLTMDALPGRTLSGVVTKIASAATNQQGVVTYSVRVRVQIPNDLQLRDGLSAVADLVLEQQSNVLLIPQQAIFGSFQQPTVKLQTASGIVERDVELGSSDDFWTVVLAGLQDGDQVVMQSSQATTNQFGSLRGLGGGALGGATFGGGGSRGGNFNRGD